MTMSKDRSISSILVFYSIYRPLFVGPSLGIHNVYKGSQVAHVGLDQWWL